MVIALIAQILYPSLRAQSKEQILSFHSRVVVREDGSLVVTETIKVQALGKKIRRGIYRDFPTLYRGPFFTRITVPFRVNRVSRNGQHEPFHLDSLPTGVRVYIGKEDRILDRGRHTYQIEYETDHQLGHFDSHDELYWNVTGTEWDFSIQEASATVVLPQSVPRDQLNMEGYTGPESSRGQSFRSSLESTGGEVRFHTTEPLDPGEGLTIVVAFPGGYISRSQRQDTWPRFREANPELIAAAVGLAVILVYYLLAWVLVGRDPERGAVLPRASPPRNLPPACIRYLRRMGFDRKCFTVALIDMAVKGYLRIDETGGTYELIRLNGKEEDLSRGEKAVVRHLLSSGQVRLSQGNRKKLKKAIKALKNVLRAQYQGTHFLANRRWLIPGMILSVPALAAIPVLGSGQLPIVGFMTVWLTIWSAGVYGLGVAVVQAWRAVLSRRGGIVAAARVAGAVFITLFFLPFLGGEILGFWMLARASSLWLIPQLLVVVAVNLCFFEWLKRPTGEGRKLMDAIDGFRLFLSGSRVGFAPTADPTRRTVELFEENLPYALALDVENEWAAQFEEVLEEAVRLRGEGHPHNWYRGDNFHSRSPGSWSDLSSSMGSAISSSTAAPGSSSGSGGGGSSGGGGGGGGGGGW